MKRDTFSPVPNLDQSGVHFEPSLDVVSLRSDVICSMNILFLLGCCAATLRPEVRSGGFSFFSDADRMQVHTQAGPRIGGFTHLGLVEIGFFSSDCIGDGRRKALSTGLIAGSA